VWDGKEMLPEALADVVESCPVPAAGIAGRGLHSSTFQQPEPFLTQNTP